MDSRLAAARRVFALVFSRDALGYAFLRAWSASLFSSSVLFAAFTDWLGWGSTVHALSIAALVVSYFLIAFGTRLLRLPSISTMRRAAFIAMEMGTILILVDLVAVLGPSALSAVGAVLTGIGSCIFALAWSSQFAQLPDDTALGAALGSYLLGAIFALALAACSPVALALLTALAPLASLVCFRSPDEASQMSHEQPAFFPVTQKHIGGLALFVTLFSIAIGAAGAFNALIATTYDSLSVLVILALCAVAVGWTLLGARTDDGFVLGFSTLTLAVFFLLLPFLGIGAPIAILGIGGQIFGRLAVWVYLIYACQRVEEQHLFILALGLGAHYAGLILGENYAGYLFSAQENLDASLLSIFSLASMFILVVSFLARGSALKRTSSSADTEDSKSGGLNNQDLRAKTHQAALQFGLTEREEELLYFLTRGFSSKSIQETLFISASTVSSHSSSIYRKMDVHSKEEAGAVVRSMESTSLAPPSDR